MFEFWKKKKSKEYRSADGNVMLRGDGSAHLGVLSASHLTVPAEEPVEQDFPATAVEWLDDPDHEFDVSVNPNAAQQAVDDAQAVRDLIKEPDLRPSILDSEGAEWKVWIKGSLVHISGEDGLVQAQFPALEVAKFLNTFKDEPWN